MAEPFVTGLPGVRSAKTATHRLIFRQGDYNFLSLGKTIKGSSSRDPLNTDDINVLRPGLLMGKVTADSKYAPSIIGVTTNAEAAGSTSIEAAAAVVTELVRRVGASGDFKLTGPPTANGVVATETVTYSAASGTTITVTAIGQAFVAGSFIQPTDGSEFAVTLIPDGYGINVFDESASAIDVQFPEFPIAGAVDSSQIINWPSDTSLRAKIFSWLNGAEGGQFVGDHRYE